VAGSADITALYTARYGVPPVGKKVYVQANQFVDGWEDLPALSMFRSVRLISVVTTSQLGRNLPLDTLVLLWHPLTIASEISSRFSLTRPAPTTRRRVTR
jgi:hypothetical protein